MKHLFLSLLLLISQPLSAQEVQVAIISINDFHASFARDDAQGKPGAAALLHTVDSLKRLYPNHLVVSAGDNFGGSFFYKATRGALLPATSASPSQLSATMSSTTVRTVWL